MNHYIYWQKLERRNPEKGWLARQYIKEKYDSSQNVYIEKYTLHLYYGSFAQKELKLERASKADSVWHN